MISFDKVYRFSNVRKYRFRCKLAYTLVLRIYELTRPYKFDAHGFRFRSVSSDSYCIRCDCGGREGAAEEGIKKRSVLCSTSVIMRRL